jgi:hypothetical protein
MKKVLMGHEEQNIVNTNINQSSEVLNLDIDNSINIQNENLVRIFLVFFFAQRF